jgi:hypothetical protein
MESAVGQGSGRCQYRLHSLLKLGPGCGRGHLPHHAYAPGYSSELLAVVSRDPDNGVYQLVAENSGDLHRQQVSSRVRKNLFTMKNVSATAIKLASFL